MTKIRFVGITLIIALIISIFFIYFYWKSLNKKDKTEGIKIICK